MTSRDQTHAYKLACCSTGGVAREQVVKYKAFLSGDLCMQRAAFLTRAAPHGVLQAPRPSFLLSPLTTAATTLAPPCKLR